MLKSIGSLRKFSLASRVDLLRLKAMYLLCFIGQAYGSEDSDGGAQQRTPPRQSTTLQQQRTQQKAEELAGESEHGIDDGEHTVSAPEDPFDNVETDGIDPKAVTDQEDITNIIDDPAKAAKYVKDMVSRTLASNIDRKSTRLNSSHSGESRMPSSA